MTSADLPGPVSLKPQPPVDTTEAFRMKTLTPAGALRLALLLPLTLTPTGCVLFGLAAQAMPQADVPARYAGLRGHSVGVMVWTDRGVQIDYPALRLELAAAVQARLQQTKAARRNELRETTFPYPAASFVRFQEDHPELAEQPIVDVAPRLNVDRVIYIEVGAVQTRADDSVDLFRGTATAAVKVIEVDRATGRAKSVYEESGIEIAYPRSAPPEGLPGVGDARIYRGTVAELATAIARRFFSYAVD